jgi:hypothetical protein
MEMERGETAGGIGPHRDVFSRAACRSILRVSEEAIVAIDPQSAATGAEAMTKAQDAEQKKADQAADAGGWFDVAATVIDVVTSAATSVGQATASAASTVTQTAGTLTSGAFETGGAIASGAIETAGSIASGVVDVAGSIGKGLGSLDL